MSRWIAAWLACAALVPTAYAQTESAESRLLSLAGRYVQEYFARAQSIVSEETVRMQPLKHDMTSDGRARQLAFEVRAEWTPSPENGAPPVARVLRELLRVDGRPPKEKDKDRCMDPRASTLEPLTLLLPERQSDYRFRVARTARERGRQAVVLEYRPVDRRAPVVEWKEDCVSVDPQGSVQGSIWIDPERGEVLRLDEQVLGMIDVPVPRKQRGFDGSVAMTLERADSSIRYRAVTFTDPDEQLMLPASVETLVVWRSAGVPRMRTSQSFANYRRFIASGRVVQ